MVFAVLALTVIGGVLAGGNGSLDVGGGERGDGGTGSGMSFDLFGGDDRYSYYHDRYYDAQSFSPQWEKDGAMATNEWQYDGLYEYGSSGSALMDEKRQGKRVMDPIYRQSALEQGDVFTSSPRGTSPAGNAPVGMADLNPYYDPYAGYSNPYANRLRMEFGRGYGPGAYSE